MGIHLASNTRLIDGVRGHFRLEFQASNKLLGDYLLHISIIMMNEVSVPQRDIQGKCREVKSGL